MSEFIQLPPLPRFEPRRGSEERAAVVRFLRMEARWQESVRAIQQASVLSLMADKIEHGEHIAPR